MCWCQNDPFCGTQAEGGKATYYTFWPRARRRIPILAPRYMGIVVYWYLGVGVYRYIGVLGGFMGDLGYLNIDILVPWGVVKPS